MAFLKRPSPSGDEPLEAGDEVAAEGDGAIKQARSNVLLQEIHMMMSTVYDNLNQGFQARSASKESPPLANQPYQRLQAGHVHSDTHINNLFDFVERTQSRGTDASRESTVRDVSGRDEASNASTALFASKSDFTKAMQFELRRFFDTYRGPGLGLQTLHEGKAAADASALRHAAADPSSTESVAKTVGLLGEDIKRQLEIMQQNIRASRSELAALRDATAESKPYHAPVAQLPAPVIGSPERGVHEGERNSIEAFAGIVGVLGQDIKGQLETIQKLIGDSVVEINAAPDDDTGAPPDSTEDDYKAFRYQNSCHMVVHDAKKDEEELLKSGKQLPSSGKARINDSHVDCGLDKVYGSQYDALGEPVYRVEDHYHRQGCAQSIARNGRFQKFTMVMLVANSIYIGISADWNEAANLYDSVWIFPLVRWCAFADKRTFFHDAWCRFDFVLVILMIVEVWIMEPILYSIAHASLSGFSMEPFRLIRLVRLVRMTRLMNVFPEGMTLIKSFYAGIRAVFSILVFISGLTYCFAIVLHALLKDNDEVKEAIPMPHQFTSVTHAGWTLLMHGTLLLDTDIVLSPILWASSGQAKAAAFVMLLFILISAVTFMNMLIGVLVDVVSNVQRRERNDSDILAMKKSILEDLIAYDRDGDGHISRSEFESVMEVEKSLKCFEVLSIDKAFLADLAHVVLPAGEDELELAHVMELMLMCRGDLPITVQHMAYAHAALQVHMNGLQEIMIKIRKDQVASRGSTRGSTRGSRRTSQSHKWNV